jgi:methionyl-tRNA synthetase
MTHKNCGSCIPDVNPSHPLLETNLHEEMATLLKEFRINQAIEVILTYASRANEFVHESKPWALFKAGEQLKGEEVLYILLAAIFKIKEAIAPVLPDFHARISEVFRNQSFGAGVKLNPIPKVFEQLAP